MPSADEAATLLPGEDLETAAVSKTQIPLGRRSAVAIASLAGTLALAALFIAGKLYYPDEAKRLQRASDNFLMADTVLGNNTVGNETVNASEVCRTVAEGEMPCWADISWAMTDGVYGHPEWYDNLPPTATSREFQAVLHKTAPDRCPMPCSPDQISPELKALVAGGGDCVPPRAMVDGKCVCGPGSELNTAPTSKFDICQKAQGPQKLTFYMYRAQSNNEYPELNVNMADLPGVMWYLHNEIVASIPRKYDVTRILRFKVVMMTTQTVFKARNSQFGPFVAFDSSQCTAQNCNNIWEEFGFVVGCQVTDPNNYNYTPSAEMLPYCHPESLPGCRGGSWYSLPGPCPEALFKDKTPECVRDWPGGGCDDPDGTANCTFSVTPAGEVTLDELEGIDEYDHWWLTYDEKGAIIASGNKEWDARTDQGVGMTFWDFRLNRKLCDQRMAAVTAMFEKKYPDMPGTMPQPACT